MDMNPYHKHVGHKYLTLTLSIHSSRHMFSTDVAIYMLGLISAYYTLLYVSIITANEEVMYTVME